MKSDNPSLGLPEGGRGLLDILAATASEIGEGFFKTLVKNVSGTLETRGAWVAEYEPSERRLRPLSLWFGDDWVDMEPYAVAGTPCEKAIEDRRLVHVPDNILEIYPEVETFRSVAAVSYLGIPLVAPDNRVLGHLAVLDTRPMPADPGHLALFRIFSERATAELRRLYAESELREKNARLERLLGQLEATQGRLAESESRFRSVAQSANDAIITADVHGNVSFWNESARRVFGYEAEEVMGKPLTMLMPDRYRDAHQEGLRRIASGEPARSVGRVIELEGLRKDGTEFPLELSLATWTSGSERFYTGTVRDITNRRQREEELERSRAQLFQSEKLASLGKLTAGVAHEINTPIGVVKSSADVAARVAARLEAALAPGGQPVPEKARELLDLLKECSRSATEAIGRTGRILKSLQNFTRIDEPDFQENVDLREGLDSTLTLLGPDLREDLEIVRDYGEIPVIACAPGELNQVFMNLTANAAEAIVGPGTITVRTFTDQGDVCVQIADTGAGISTENLNRIFEPGFSTKGSRVKVGLGLFNSHSIVQKHGGRLEVESEIGAGSTFTVRLPVGTR